MEPFEIKLNKIRKQYGTRVILDDLDLQIHNGEFISITGPSGCGKSTLLNTIGLLDNFEGEYWVNSKMIKRNKFPEVRNSYIGFVFQLYYLLPNLNVRDNILLPLMYAQKAGIRKAPQILDEVTDALGIKHLMKQKVDLLSGGEKQRVAIARAMILQPRILVADEPTGALDEKNATDVIRCFQDYVQKGNSVVMVTHNLEISMAANRRYALDGGKLHEIK